jgi:transposase
MRYTQGEKLEIIRLVEESDLPIKTTLKQLQVGRASFYRWYRAYVDRGAEGLAAKPSSRRRFWNRIPDKDRERVVELSLQMPEKSARELAFFITDNEGYFISESSVYRILRAYDLVTSPAYIVMSAAANRLESCGYTSKKRQASRPAKIQQLFPTRISGYSNPTVPSSHRAHYLVFTPCPTLPACEVPILGASKVLHSGSLGVHGWAALALPVKVTSN